VTQLIKAVAAKNTHEAVLRIPEKMPRGFLLDLGGRAALRGREALLTPNRVRFLTRDHGSDISKTERDLGFLPKG